MRGDAKRTLSTPVAIPEKHQFHHSHTVGEISTGNGTDDCGGNLSPTEAASDVNSNKPPQRRAPSLKYCSSKYLYSAQVQTDMARTSGGTSPNSPVSSGLYFPHSLSPIRSRANSENKKDWRPRDGDTFFSPNPRPRTWSMPAKHCRRRGQSADEPLPPAVCAIPEYAGNGQLQRVRSFTLSSKGLKNRGDSYKKKTTGSNQSMGQLDNFCSLVTEEEFRQRTSSVNSQGSLTHRSCGSGSSEFRPSYKVVIFGAGDVGRTSLTRQFMTSEYMGAFDASFEEVAEKSVSVLLDGVESEMYFLDPPHDQDYTYHEDADAFVIVYSVVDRQSFDFAVELLTKMRKQEGIDNAIILVGNKTDIVRTRLVTTEEGRDVAERFDCKCIETSAVLNHQIDELLVGTLSQIRLKEKQNEKKRKQKFSIDAVACLQRHSPKKLISRFWKKNPVISKSCDNLYVL